MYRLLSPLRQLSETQCHTALAAHVPAGQTPVLAEQAFVHRIWNLTDLLLADRWLHRGTYARLGGRLAPKDLSKMRDAARRGKPVILVSAYYGPFDLLPIFLGYNNLPATVVYLRHGNRAFDAYRRRIRERSGCELVPVEDAPRRFEQVLSEGGRVALVADHHAESRGMEVTFLGLPTRVSRSVGLLAARYEADVVVAGIRRQPEPFRFELVVEDVFKPIDWQDTEDPVTWITHRYLRGLERLVLADPSQYLWAHPRWGRAFAEQCMA